MAVPGVTGWQQEILAKLHDRDVVDRGHADIIEHYKKLAAQTVLLTERNRNLLKAAASTVSRSGPGASSPANGAKGGGDNAVQQAFIASLESQIAALRDELAGAYKAQAQNAQRVVNLTEQIQGVSDRASVAQAELVQLRSERASREREREEALMVRRDKDKSIEVLQDELAMLRLEFDMMERKNEELKEDNSSLLRRWLEKKASEAAEMDKMLENGGKKPA